MIAWAHNAVPLKHFPRLVTGHLHCHPFGDPGSDQVSDRRPTEIMGDASRQPSLFASRRPSLPISRRSDDPPGQRPKGILSPVPAGAPMYVSSSGADSSLRSEKGGRHYHRQLMHHPG